MISQNELLAALNYDANTGVFTWVRKVRPRSKINDAVGHTCKKDGYLIIGLNKKLYMAHRLAWLYAKGHYPCNQVDHINGNRSDNRLCNLRVCDNTQNSFNSKIRKDNTSGFKGVHFYKRTGKWTACGRVNKKLQHLGTFDTAQDASDAYNKFAKESHGDFYNDTTKYE